MAGGGIVIDDHAHDVAVEDMYLRTAAHDEMVFVPVAVADKCGELLRVADRADDLSFLSWSDAGDLATERVERATALFVVLPSVFVLPVDIRLRAGQREGQSGDVGAMVVDAAVAPFRDAVLRLELEVAREGAVPDDKGIILHDGRRRNLADDCASFAAPIFRVAGPTFEALAVEHLFPAEGSFG